MALNTNASYRRGISHVRRFCDAGGYISAAATETEAITAEEASAELRNELEDAPAEGRGLETEMEANEVLWGYARGISQDASSAYILQRSPP